MNIDIYMKQTMTTKAANIRLHIFCACAMLITSLNKCQRLMIFTGIDCEAYFAFKMSFFSSFLFITLIECNMLKKSRTCHFGMHLLMKIQHNCKPMKFDDGMWIVNPLPQNACSNINNILYYIPSANNNNFRFVRKRPNCVQIVRFEKRKVSSMIMKNMQSTRHDRLPLRFQAHSIVHAMRA